MAELSRGEIYMVDWSPGRGSEQTGVRPGLVIQRDTANLVARYPVTIMLAISSQLKGYPSNVRLDPTASNGLSVSSEVMTGQILTISKARLGVKLGKIDAGDLARVEEVLKYMLALT